MDPRMSRLPPALYPLLPPGCLQTILTSSACTRMTQARASRQVQARTGRRPFPLSPHMPTTRGRTRNQIISRILNAHLMLLTA